MADELTFVMIRHAHDAHTYAARAMDPLDELGRRQAHAIAQRLLSTKGLVPEGEIFILEPHDVRGVQTAVILGDEFSDAGRLVRRLVEPGLDESNVFSPENMPQPANDARVVFAVSHEPNITALVEVTTGETVAVDHAVACVVRAPGRNWRAGFDSPRLAGVLRP